MNKKTVLMLILALSLVAIFASQVSAAEMPNMFEQLFKPFGNLEQAYDKYFPFIDMIIYLIIFLGLTQATIGRKFEGKGGKLVTTGIGIIFAVSLALWEKQANFNIKTFGPIAMGVLIAVMCVALYTGMTSFGLGKGGAFAFSYIAFFSVLGTFGVMAWFSDKTPILALITTIIFFVAIVIGILELVKWIRKLKGGGEQTDEGAAEIEAEIEEEGKDLKTQEAELAADTRTEVNPEVKKKIGDIITEFEVLEDLLKKLEEDVAIHQKYHKKHSEILAKQKRGEISKEDAVEREAKSDEAYSTEKLNFDITKLEGEIARAKKMIADAKAGAQSVKTQANLTDIQKNIASFEQRLKKIEQYSRGGA